jgi:serine/threonine-protein kinase
VLAGAGLAVWQAQVARAEKKRAEEVKEFIASIFRDTDPYLRSEGKPLTAIDLLKQANRRLDEELATQPRVRVELLGVLGRSYLGLLDTRNAETVLTRALRESEGALSPDDLLTIRVRLWLAEAKYYLGQIDEARAHLLAASSALVRSRNTRGAEFVDARLLQTVISIGEADYDGAEKSAREAVETSTQALGATSDLTAQGLFMLAMVYRNQDKLDLALATAEKAYRLQLEIRKKDAKHPTVIDAQVEYGRALAAVGRIEAAVQNLKEAVANARELYGPSALTGNFLASLARVRLDHGEIGLGIENARESLAILEKEGSPSDVDRAYRERTLGLGLLTARRASEALPHLKSATEIGSKTKDEHGLLLSRAGYGLALVYLGRFQDAELELQQVVAERRAGRPRAIHQPLSHLGTLRRLQGQHEVALGLFEEAAAAARNRALSKVDLAQVLTGSGLTRLEMADYDGALRSLEEARALLDEVQKEKTPAKADAWVGLGRARMAQGQLADALPLLEAADRFWVEFDGANRWAGEAALWLGHCHAALGRAEDARRALARAEKLLSRSPIPSDSRLVQQARR